MTMVESKKKDVKEKKEVKKEILYRVYPDIYKNIDYDKMIVEIEVSLPGVKKENISLKALPTWFKLHAIRDDMEYSAQTSFGVEIVPEKTTAKYIQGLLSIQAHIKNPLDDAREISF